MILAADYPTWQSTLAVLALLGTGLTLYYMRAQSQSFREQTELMRRQMSTPQTQVIQPQPFDVRIIEELHDQFANRQEFHDHRTEVQRKFNDVWTTLRAENQRIGDGVAATRESLAAMRSLTDLQNQQLAAIQSDIKRILERR